QSIRAASTGRTHDCKRPMCGTRNDLLPSGGHPHMRRRDVIALLGGTTMLAPFAARAHQAGVPVIGFIHVRSPENSHDLVRGLKRGLAENGYTDGQNVAIDFRWG